MEYPLWTLFATTDAMAAAVDQIKAELEKKAAELGCSQIECYTDPNAKAITMRLIAPTESAKFEMSRFVDTVIQSWVYQESKTSTAVTPVAKGHKVSPEVVQKLHVIANDRKATFDLDVADRRWFIVGLDDTFEVGSHDELEEKYFNRPGPFLLQPLSAAGAVVGCVGGLEAV